MGDQRDQHGEAERDYGRDYGEAWEPRTFRSAPERGKEAGGYGGYGQAGTDPGQRVSPYGDRVYQGGRPAQSGADYETTPRQDHPGEYRTLRDPGHRGRGPQGYRRSDQRISEDVHDRLTDDPYIDASGIVVAVTDGEVTLSGVITDRPDKRHAEAIVERIGGVTHVQNNLRLKGGAGRGLASLGGNTVLRDQAEGQD